MSPNDVFVARVEQNETASISRRVAEGVLEVAASLTQTDCALGLGEALLGEAEDDLRGGEAVEGEELLLSLHRELMQMSQEDDDLIGELFLAATNDSGSQQGDSPLVFGSSLRPSSQRRQTPCARPASQPTESPMRTITCREASLSVLCFRASSRGALGPLRS